MHPPGGGRWQLLSMHNATTAVLLDFNGTLSNDECLLADCYEELIELEGIRFDRDRYFAEIAGGSDAEIFGAWLGHGNPAIPELICRRVVRYLARASDGHTIDGPAREAVRILAKRVPVAIVSSAYWVEIETVLTGAGLTNHVSTIVAIEDVRHHKPSPEGYQLALQRLGIVSAASAIAVEDSAVGIEAATAAGLPCIAVLGTMPADRLAGADHLVERLCPSVATAILGGEAPNWLAGHVQHA